MYYFAFVAADDTVFNPAIHSVEDLYVREFAISQNEGEFARANIVAENPGISNIQDLLNQYLLISEDGVLLFRGRILGLPDITSGAFVSLDAISQPDDWQDTLDDEVQALKVAPFWDDLFVDPDLRDDPAEVLDARPSFFNWDRSSHALSTESVLASGVDIDLGGEIDANSFRMSFINEPISKVNLALNVNWVQSRAGRVRIDQRIINAFGPENDFNMRTFTPDAFLASWPAQYASLAGDSGWYALISNINEVAQDVEVLTRDNESEEEETADVTRFSYGTTFVNGLTLQYNYRQARQETCSIELEISNQDVYSGNERIEDIEITLEDITIPLTPEWRPDTFYEFPDKTIIQGQEYQCEIPHTSPAAVTDYDDILDFWVLLDEDSTPLGNTSRAAFLDTDRGIEAIEHALEIGRTRAIISALALQTDGRGLWEDLSTIDCTTTIRVATPFAPNGEIIGKVNSYSLVVNSNGSRWVEFSLLSSVGTGDAQPIPDTGTPSYCVTDYVENDYQVFVGQQLESAGEIVFDVTADELYEPVNASRLDSPSYSIRDIEVLFPANQQLVTMQQAWEDTGDSFDVEDSISEQQTEIKIDMRDLTPEDVIMRGYQVETEPYENQKDIDLS